MKTPTKAQRLVYKVLESYAGFDADYLNSRQPIPEKRAVIYKTPSQSTAIQTARAMRDRYGINVWVDGTVCTGWRVLVHAADFERGRRMALSV